MSTTLKEILIGLSRLEPDELTKVREEIERIETEQWDTELTRQSEQLDRAGLTDETIDALVLKRRYESRP